ncbi:leucine-rich repeat-containing protein 14B [Scleropages formosus]|uniref:Leucine-rich repeat-containing protein 14B n=1 Tax=Scleropages formosus TaxID=113540 RepID=A0A8C9RMG0_SCLFO|nr:leucine-rich repeat-containing protein 14B [Scleropages formosus]
MKTLKFLSAESFARGGKHSREDVACVSHNLYPVLFKASYLHEEPRLLRDLVRAWPLPELSVRGLLGRTPDCPQDLTSRTCRRCLEALLTGLKDYVLLAAPAYAKSLRAVDLTALRDTEHQLCPCKRTMGRWTRTQLACKVCLEVIVALQSGNAAPGAARLQVDVRLNAFVTGRNYEEVSHALALQAHCPLKLRCVGLRADSLSLKQLFYVVRLAEPPGVRRLEVVHNVRLEAPHLELLLTRLQFPQLRSLALPARALDVRRLGPGEERLLETIGELLSRLTQLTELYLAFSTLTGQLRRLLSPLHTPLQCLELANCALNRMDMIYLANSLHSEHLVSLDLSGHDLVELFPNTFHKLLRRCAGTLTSLTMEECGLEDQHVDMLTQALAPCRALRELKFLGNPLSATALRRLFSNLVGFPLLRYVEMPVPRDCYPTDATYPLDEATLVCYDRERFQEVRTELLAILHSADRGDVEVCTPLFGAYDPDLNETSNELGTTMLLSLKDVLGTFLNSITALE